MPLVTVLVGKKTDGQQCRVLTLTEGVDDPNYVEFPVPTESSPLTPGTPKWANYVKGVVNFYKGIFLLYIFLYVLSGEHLFTVISLADNS